MFVIEKELCSINSLFIATHKIILLYYDQERKIRLWCILIYYDTSSTMKWKKNYWVTLQYVFHGLRDAHNLSFIYKDAQNISIKTLPMIDSFWKFVFLCGIFKVTHFLVYYVFYRSCTGRHEEIRTHYSI